MKEEFIIESIYWLLVVFPFITGFIWALIIGMQIRQKRYKLLQDRLFLIFSASMALLCVIDPIVLYMTSFPNTWLFFLARIDLSLFAFNPLMVVLLNKIYISEAGTSEHIFYREKEFEKANIAFVLIVGIIIGLIFWKDFFIIDSNRTDTYVNISFNSFQYNAIGFTIFISYAVVMSVIGVWYINKLRIIANKYEHTREKATQLRKLFWAFIIMLIIGLASNAVNIVLEAQGLQILTPPLFSTIIIIPTILLLLAFAHPLQTKTLGTEVIFALFKERLPSSPFKLEELYLAHDNKIIFKKGLQPERRVQVYRTYKSAREDDIRAARRSILSAITSGKLVAEEKFNDAHVLVERGDRVQLVVLITGRRNPDLAEVMRLVVRDVERSLDQAPPPDTPTNSINPEIKDLLINLFDDPLLLQSDYNDHLDIIKGHLGNVKQKAEEAEELLEDRKNASIRKKLQTRVIGKVDAAVMVDDIGGLTGYINELESGIKDVQIDIERKGSKKLIKGFSSIVGRIQTSLKSVSGMMEELPKVTLQVRTKRIIRGKRSVIKATVQNQGSYPLRKINIILLPSEDLEVQKGSVFIEKLPRNAIKEGKFNVKALDVKNFQLKFSISYQSPLD